MASAKGSLNIPTVDKAFVEKMLGQKIAEFNTSSGSKSGDNMMGTLLCLDVTLLDGQRLQLVVKSVLPLTGKVNQETVVNSKFIAASKTFVKEIVYFARLRPVFLQVWREAMDTEKMAFFTDPVVHAQLNDKLSAGLYDYIAMDDLRPRGFKMVDKMEGLSFEETSATLKHLALIHATSYSLLNGTGRLSKELLGILNDPESLACENGLEKDFVQGCDQEKLLNDIVARMIDIIDKIKPEVTPKLKKFANDGYNKMIRLWKQTTPKGKYFRVLNHGDLWTNNILFKHSKNGGVEDIKFIDYQFVHFGNIYEDLQYFIYTSTTAEFRRLKLATCWQLYYKEFELILKQLGAPMPEGFTEDQFRVGLRDSMEYGFIFGLFAIPWQLGIPVEGNDEATNDEPEEEIDLEADARNQEVFDKMVEDLATATTNSPIAQQRLIELVDEMVEQGFL